MVGAVLGRRLWFDHDHHKLFPMLNLLLIGPSGLGKSTSLGMGFNLIYGLPKADQPQIIMGTTPERLYDDLRANPHAILYASELAAFFTKQKYMERMIPDVTELLDYKTTFERRTKSGGVISVPEPAVAVMGGSTVEWLQEQLPDSATSGGFLARFLILAEDHKAQRIALPGRSFTRSQRDELLRKRDLVNAEFQQKTEYAPQGAIDFKNYEVSDIYEEWYNSHEPETGHLAPFHARAGEFVLRLSIISAVCAGKSCLESDDVQFGISVYSHCEAKLGEVVVPFTPQGKLLSLVLKSIGTGSMSEAELCKAMQNFAASQEIQKYVTSLVLSGDLRRLPNGRYERA